MKRGDPKKERQARDARRSARAVIGEPSRGRKRGPHKVREREPPLEELDESEYCELCPGELRGHMEDEDEES